MDTDRLKELAPHYAAMLVLVFLVLGIVRLALGEVNFWIELPIIVIIVFAYRPIVKRLGIGPTLWR